MPLVKLRRIQRSRRRHLAEPDARNGTVAGNDAMRADAGNGKSPTCGTRRLLGLFVEDLDRHAAGPCFHAGHVGAHIGNGITDREFNDGVA